MKTRRMSCVFIAILKQPATPVNGLAMGDHPWLGGPMVVMLSAVDAPPGPSVAAVHGPEGPSMAAALGPGGPIVGGPLVVGQATCA